MYWDSRIPAEIVDRGRYEVLAATGVVAFVS